MKKKNTSPVRRNAAATRLRILDSARAAFYRAPYERVGLRDIAAAAGVDASLINRYFGSKKNLFQEALTGAFEFEASLESTEKFARAFVGYVARQKCGGSAADPADKLGVILRSAVSQEASPIVSGIFHREFTLYLAGLLPGRDREMRAAMVGAYLAGFRLLCEALDEPSLNPADSEKIVALLIKALKPCFEGD
ncbi:MAG: TetR/AcrR family transcriptional regulator [Candidatus Adiutrix sp.]|nr:TetR/AcrR family transcriptional regulator [Candidatus Adiutrix sp.]